jgi:hypothetical protein
MKEGKLRTKAYKLALKQIKLERESALMNLQITGDRVQERADKIFEWLSKPI